MFSKKDVFKTFAKLAGKRCNRISFLVKKETLAQVFSCEFCKDFKNSFFYRTLRGTASNYFPNKTRK